MKKKETELKKLDYKYFDIKRRHTKDLMLNGVGRTNKGLQDLSSTVKQRFFNKYGESITMPFSIKDNNNGILIETRVAAISYSKKTNVASVRIGRFVSCNAETDTHKADFVHTEKTYDIITSYQKKMSFGELLDELVDSIADDAIDEYHTLTRSLEKAINDIPTEKKTKK